MRKILLSLLTLFFIFTSCSFSSSVGTNYIHTDLSLKTNDSICTSSGSIFYATVLNEKTNIETINGTEIAFPIFDNKELNEHLLNSLCDFLNSIDLPFSPQRVDFYTSEAFNTKTYTFYVSDSADISNNSKYYFSIDKSTNKIKSIYDFMTEYQFNKLMLDLYNVANIEIDSIEVTSSGVNVYSDNQAYFIDSKNFQTENQFSVFYHDDYHPVLDSKEKYVAITFDDGPNPYSTNELLKILKDNDVKATFFMVGYNILEYPSLVNKIFSEHHDIGIHSFGHSDYSQMNFEDVLDDLDKCSNLIYDIVGKRPYLVRPPYGNINTYDINTTDYFFVNWNVDPYDWKLTSPEQIAQEALKAVKPGSIILLHDIYKTSCEAAEIIIKKLKLDGYRFVTISEYFNLDGKKSDNKLHFFREDYNVKEN